MLGQIVGQKRTVLPRRKTPVLPVPPVDSIIISTLVLAALIPRILLAIQLDLVTDEVVYILGGKIYFPLIEHLSIGNAGWHYNYEHPPFVKLFIGLSLAGNAALGHPLGELFAARLPSILCGTLMVGAIYWLGKDAFGRMVALAAALSLAFSPWLVYFSALAYLDMTMTALITVAFLLLWHALRHPWLYLLSAALVGLAAASKYTAVLVIPGMVLFTLYYFLALRPHLPIEQRPAIPWRWWLTAVVLFPLTFLSADPAIWSDPYHLLLRSFQFEWEHAATGHLTFLAGHYGLFVPHWAMLYTIAVKISIFLTAPALLFVLIALVRLIRFHLHSGELSVTRIAENAFLLAWLIVPAAMFSLLNIVVGTHYYLPLAVPVTLAGTSGLAILLRSCRDILSTLASREGRGTAISGKQPGEQFVKPTWRKASSPHIAWLLALLLIVAVSLPHLLGLVTVDAAEGYTSEIFAGEDAALQIAYPGYRDAVRWLAAHTDGPVSIGLVALPNTLDPGRMGVSWYNYNSDLPARFHLSEVNPGDSTFTNDYLVWPMHLIQRGYLPPEAWRAHLLHSIMGGKTTYCSILARPSPARTSTESRAVSAMALALRAIQ
ncbi:MAG: glycosyltransferase family 39 protein [Ktedonobacteraceae bacterium]|nr:glycosyltransferase family 39 protein [Ktedonobacteraceae bacterium]